MLKKWFGRLFSCKTLYVICFIAINLIEFLKASQTGDVWYVAVNCTGLVMMVILFSAYPLRDFLTRGNVVYTLFCLAAMAGVYLHWLQNIGHYNLWQRETALLNVWWLGILLKYLFEKILVQKQIPLKPDYVGWIWIALSVFMICSVSQKLWPLWYFLMFGAFYLTKYTPERGRALREGMVDGTILSFFGIQIYAYGFRPYDTVRYVGAYGNCNAMALYYLVVYCMVLFKLHQLQMKKAHKGWKLFYLTGAGGLLCFQLFTLCRTAWLVSAVITLLYGVLVIRKYWGLTWGCILMRGGALALSAALTFLPVYETIRWLPTILHYRIWYDGEYSVDKVHSFDPPNSDKYVSLEEFMEEAAGRILRTLNGAENKPQEAEGELPAERRPEEAEAGNIRQEGTMPQEPEAGSMEQKGTTPEESDSEEIEQEEENLERVELVSVPWTQDESTRIRLTIYKTYLRDMKWFGNGPGSGYYKIGDTGYQSWHAQNLWIQMGYTFGIPAGILSIALTLAILISQIRKIRGNIGGPYRVLPIFVCAIFFLFGLTEIVWNLGQIIMFLMYFVQHPDIFRD
ncbi:MAG: O-antigen ligase family protein [Roseburia sp.]|nr:O-antigen ligase family protein [Roseburia sp.]